MTMDPNTRSTSTSNLTELERKRQKLAELRSQRARAEEERRKTLIGNSALPGIQQNGERVTATPDELRELLAQVGVDPEPRIERTPEKTNGLGPSTNVSPMASQIMSSSRVLNLEMSNVQSVAVPVKNSAQYSKTTQTDDERISVGEFSLGSQEFDYDDDMMPMDGGFRGRAHSHDLESPMPEDLSSILPGFQFGKKKEEAEVEKVTEEPARPRELSEEEKAQIMNSMSFQTFFSYSAKVIERALAEEERIFVDYDSDNLGEVVASSDRLVLSRILSEEKWSTDRMVTGVTFSTQHPELMAVAYDQNPNAPMEPSGVVLVWNTKFKTTYPEYVFTCQSRLTSVAFARFHAHLLMAGCYSGQICMWDSRVVNKKTPIHKSPLSSTAHTHPVSALTVIGSKNANNLVSLSTDGRICSWNVDNLAQPVDGKDILNKAAKPFPVQCMSFPVAEMNNFVVGSESGRTCAISRHGGAASSAMEVADFVGHTGPVSSVAFHRATGAVDFSHLFLSCGCDWTVRLWSTKDPQLKFAFESHTDFVYDVAWSPVHPAVFTSVDAEGNLFLWNLNEDLEGPVARLKVAEEDVAPGFVRKVVWAENGQQLAIGDEKGRVHIFDVHESMYVLRSEEWTRFARVLHDIKQASEEADEMNEVMSRLTSTGSATSVVAQLAGINVSPRQAGRI